MRSNLVIVVTVVASLVLASQMAAADPVQEQLRLMEQRMTEMEDRLQATSDELRSAKVIVDQQQGLLSDAGLIDESDTGIRSGVSSFLEEVDFSGVIAASYNHRIADAGNSNDLAGGNALFRHPDADTFALDQLWLVVDKPVSEESRGGFHFEFVTGQTGLAQGGNNTDEPYLYSGYVSYLAPIAGGIQIDVGRLATPLGAEVEQTNGNFFVTQGNVFALQPVTHTGIQASGNITDEISAVFGVVNEVYSDTFTSTTVDKAYFGQVAYTADAYAVKVGFISGNDTAGVGGPGCVGASCKVTVIDVVLTADPTDDISLWVNYDYVNNEGGDYTGGVNGQAHGIAGAGRFALTDRTGVATRVEFVRIDEDMAGTGDDIEVVSLTGTIDHSLTDNLVVRGEVRWDHSLDDSLGFAPGVPPPGAPAGSPPVKPRPSGTDNDQVVVMAEIYYAF